jgi:hypothetical protein
MLKPSQCQAIRFSARRTQYNNNKPAIANIPELMVCITNVMASAFNPYSLFSIPSGQRKAKTRDQIRPSDSPLDEEKDPQNREVPNNRFIAEIFGKFLFNLKTRPLSSTWAFTQLFYQFISLSLQELRHFIWGIGPDDSFLQTHGHYRFVIPCELSCSSSWFCCCGVGPSGSGILPFPLPCLHHVTPLLRDMVSL